MINYIKDRTSALFEGLNENRKQIISIKFTYLKEDSEEENGKTLYADVISILASTSAFSTPFAHQIYTIGKHKKWFPTVDAALKDFNFYIDEYVKKLKKQEEYSKYDKEIEIKL